MKSKRFNFLVFICLIFFFTNSKGQLQIIGNVPIHDDCTSQLLGTLSVVNPDLSHTYEWFYENYSQWNWPGYSLTLSMSFSTGYGPTINFYPLAWASYGCTIFSVLETDQAQNIVGSGYYGYGCRGNMLPIPVLVHAQNCYDIEVPPSFGTANISGRSPMWYKNGLPTGFNGTYIHRPDTGTYQFKLVLACGDTISSDPVYISYQSPIPAISTNGPATICQGDTALLTTASGFSNYKWSRNDTIIAGATSNSHKAIQSGNYIVSYDQFGCYLFSNPAQITLQTGVYITAADTARCVGDSILLQCNSALSYQWKINGINIPGATSQNLYVKTTGSYQVSTTGFTCNTSKVKNITFYNYPVVSTTPSATIYVCSGNGINIIVTGTNMSTFQWKLNGVNIVGGTIPSIYINSSGNYTCTVANPVGCSATTPAVNVNVLSSVSLPTKTDTLQPDTAGIDTYCTYYFGANYAYFYNGATPYINVSNYYYYYNVLETGLLRFNLSVVPPGAALISSELRLYIDTLLGWTNNPENFVINPAVQPWTENTANWFNKPFEMNHMSFLIPHNSLAPQSYLQINGSSFNTLTANWLKNPSTNYGLQMVFDSQGPLPNHARMLISSSDNTIASHRPRMIIQYTYAKIDTSGNTTFFQGDSVTFTTNSGFNNYQWYQNNIPISGATSNQFTAKTAGDYYVVIANSNGCAVSSPIKHVTIPNAFPIVNVSPAGPLSFCYGHRITLVADSISGYTFQWKKNNLNITGATSRSYIVSQTGNYTVLVTNIFGSVLSTVISCTRIVNPVPFVTYTGSLVFCPPQTVTFNANSFTGVTYQWQRNGVNINGATSQSYLATSPFGSYRVRETANGCSYVSKPWKTTSNCRWMDQTDDSDPVTITIQPNPLNNYATIILPAETDLSESEIIIYDIFGKVVQKFSMPEEYSIQFDRGNLSAGIYNVLLIKNEIRVASVKMVIE